MTVELDHGGGTERRARQRAETLQVLAVVVACLAFVFATVAMGLSARSASNSTSATRAVQASLADISAVRSATSAASKGASVDVTEHDFAIAAASATVQAGLVDFRVHNEGPSQHEFLIFKTDLPPDKLPLGSDGRVDETSPGADKVFDSQNNLDVGASSIFHTALLPGRYVLVCNLPGHYLAGMHTAFTVN